MSNNYKKLADADFVEIPQESANVLIVEDGVVKQVPNKIVGGSGGITGYDIFVIGGQSNAVGSGTPRLSTDVFPAKTYQYTQGGNIEAATEYLSFAGMNGGVSSSHGVNFQYTFVEKYIADSQLANGRAILLVPCAVPGTSFLSGRWAEGGDLHTAMLDRITAVRDLVGDKGTFKAVLWHQGESDVADRNTVDNYKAQLGKLIDNTREITGTIPFIMGEWQRDWLATQSNGDNMLAGLYALSKEKEDVHVVSSAMLAGDDAAGNIHFSAEAQRTFGKRYYTTYKSTLAAKAVFDVVRLDARSGTNGATWKDESGSGNHASLYNFDGTETSGFSNGSLHFDGANDYAELPADIFNFGAADDFTFMVIARIGGDNQALLSNTNVGNSQKSFQVFTMGGLYFQTAYGAGSEINKTYGTLSVGNLTSYAIVKSGSALTLYCNGVAIHAGNMGANGMKEITTPMTFGRWGRNESMWMNGEIKFIGVASKALTPEQMAAVARDILT